MISVNLMSNNKFVIVLNEKSHLGKLLSATGQLAMSLYSEATLKQREGMNFVPFIDPTQQKLINLSTTSFIVLRGKQSQLLALFIKASEQKSLSAIFTSTMSFNGVEEDLILKTASISLDDAEVYGVGIYDSIEKINPLTKKFSVFK